METITTMADEIVAPAAAPAAASPAPSPAPVPVAAQPVVPAVAAAAAPLVVTPPAAVEGAAPIAEPTTEPAAEPAKPATIIGEALAKPAADPVPPVEGETPPGEPKAPEGQSAEPAPPPAYEPFTLPEGITLEAERLGEFTTMLGEFELNAKVDHASMQQFGQQLVDRHIAEVTNAVTRLNKSYQDRWEQQKIDWKDQFLADTDIGGNRFQTTVDSALSFIRTHGGTEAQQAEFQALMESSGLGNHPAMIRMLANAGRAMSEGRPLAATAPPAAPKSKTEAMYGRRKA